MGYEFYFRDYAHDIMTKLHSGVIAENPSVHMWLLQVFRADDGGTG